MVEGKSELVQNLGLNAKRTPVLRLKSLYLARF
jgi:hypothetical protein